MSWIRNRWRAVTKAAFMLFWSIGVSFLNTRTMEAGSVFVGRGPHAVIVRAEEHPYWFWGGLAGWQTAAIVVFCMGIRELTHPGVDDI